MAFPGIPNFPVGLGLQDGDRLNNFVHNTLSVDPSVRAHAGGGQQFATLIDAVVSVITRVTTAGDSVQLPPTEGRLGFGPSLAGLQLLLINSASNACQVFGNYFEPNCTIGGVAGTTGVSLAGGSSLSLVCGGPGVWISIAGGAGGGLPITGGTLSGFLGMTTAQGLTGTGTNQVTATLVQTQVSVISSAPSGTGFRLPLVADVGVLGPIELQNRDAVNPATVYPPVGGQIDGFGTNIAAVINPLSSSYLVPGTTFGQWWSS